MAPHPVFIEQTTLFIHEEIVIMKYVNVYNEIIVILFMFNKN